MGATRGTGTVSPSGVPEFNNVLIEQCFLLNNGITFSFGHCIVCSLIYDWITPLVSSNFSIAVTETILPKISIFSKDVGYFSGLTEITRIPAPHEIQCTRYCLKEQMCVFFSFHAENGCILYQRENSVMKSIDCLKENSLCCSMENVKHSNQKLFIARHKTCRNPISLLYFFLFYVHFCK